MIITATDADEENTPHSEIGYSIMQQDPNGMQMFRMESSSGEVKVRMNTLDREVRASVIKCQLNHRTTIMSQRYILQTQSCLL